MTTAPYNWIKKVEESLEELKVIPLWGNVPPFPWKATIEHVTAMLHLQNFTLNPQDTEWRSSKELTEGMGQEPMSIALELSPLPGFVHWVFSAEDVSKLISSTLSFEPLFKSFSDKGLKEGYFTYLSLLATQAVDQMRAFGDLSVRLAAPTPLPQEGALCTDFAIGIKNEKLWGRLICPSEFLHAFRQHFSKKRVPLNKNELRHEVDVEVRLDIGKTHLALQDLKQVSQGDFILLEQCSFDPETKKGAVTLTLQETPIFQLLLSDGQLTISDYSLYNEEGSSMAPKDFDDEDEDLDNDEESEDEDLDEDEEEEDDDEDLDDDEDDEEEEDEDEDLDEDEDEDVDEEEEEEDLEQEGEEEEDEAEEEEARAEEPYLPASRETTAVGKAITGERIAVTLTVEIARMTMNLDKLLELQPGNVLDLPVTVDHPLDIRMNGKRIAKGELIKMGDLLGIKILRIGEV